MINGSLSGKSDNVTENRNLNLSSVFAFLIVNSFEGTSLIYILLFS